MLPPHYQELLTAYVDGELTARQRRAVARLLRRSGESRILLRKLQDDAAHLRALPVRTAPDLSGSVLEAIARRRLKPTRRPPVATIQPAFPAWTGMAAAAAVLLLVGLGSFLHYSRSSGRQDLARRQHRPGVAPGQHSPTEKGVAQVTPDREEPTPLPPDPVVPPEDTIEKRPGGKTPEKPERPAPKKQGPETPQGPVYTSGDKETPEPIDQGLVPSFSPATFHKIHELDQARPAAQLRERLATFGAWRIEMPARETARAFDRIKAAFQARKIPLLIEPSAAHRLGKPQFKHDFAIFLENVTPQDLVALLGVVGQTDRAAPAGKTSSESRFNGLIVVKEIERPDVIELTELMGADPINVRPKPTIRVPRIDIRRPLPEATEADVAAALVGKGVPRPTASLPENGGVVLSLSGAPARSPRLKQFLENRKPALVNTLQVLLVLRTVKP